MNFLSILTGCFATPVAENPTVVMVEAAYRHHGINARYINCDVPPERLSDAVRGARAMGWVGFNCSLPNKVAVIGHLDGLGQSAEIMGAVNCAVRRGDRFIGENTDGKGFLKSLMEVVDPKEKRVVMFGAGGAARAIGFLARDQESSYPRSQILPYTPPRRSSRRDRIATGVFREGRAAPCGRSRRPKARRSPEGSPKGASPSRDVASLHVLRRLRESEGLEARKSGRVGFRKRRAGRCLSATQNKSRGAPSAPRSLDLRKPRAENSRRAAFARPGERRSWLHGISADAGKILAGRLSIPENLIRRVVEVG